MLLSKHRVRPPMILYAGRVVSTVCNACLLLNQVEGLHKAQSPWYSNTELGPETRTNKNGRTMMNHRLLCLQQRCNPFEYYEYLMLMKSSLPQKGNSPPGPTDVPTKILASHRLLPN